MFTFHSVYIVYLLIIGYKKIRRDKIRNDDIRETIEVAPIVK